MTSRERVLKSLNHEEPDRVPLDLGASVLTGMHVSSIYKLRQTMKLDPPGTPIKVLDPYQMLGEVEMDLVDALGVDVVQAPAAATLFGYKLDGWKPWKLFDGTPLLVPEGFNTEPETNGDVLMYPEGDRRAAPSGRIPAGGFYFDVIVRQPPLDEAMLNPDDNTEEFTPISEADLAYFEHQVEQLYRETDKAVFAGFCFSSFGDIALVPAPWLKNPKGIRDIEEWYISTVARREWTRRG